MGVEVFRRALGPQAQVGLGEGLAVPQGLPFRVIPAQAAVRAHALGLHPQAEAQPEAVNLFRQPGQAVGEAAQVHLLPVPPLPGPVGFPLRVPEPARVQHDEVDPQFRGDAGVGQHDVLGDLRVLIAPPVVPAHQAAVHAAEGQGLAQVGAHILAQPLPAPGAIGGEHHGQGQAFPGGQLPLEHVPVHGEQSLPLHGKGKAPVARPAHRVKPPGAVRFLHKEVGGVAVAGAPGGHRQGQPRGVLQARGHLPAPVALVNVGLGPFQGEGVHPQGKTRKGGRLAALIHQRALPAAECGFPHLLPGGVFLKQHQPASFRVSI